MTDRPTDTARQQRLRYAERRAGAKPVDYSKLLLNTVEISLLALLKLPVM